MDIPSTLTAESNTDLKLDVKKQSHGRALPKEAEFENVIADRMSPRQTTLELVKSNMVTTYRSACRRYSSEASEANKSSRVVVKRAKYSQQSLQATSTNVSTSDEDNSDSGPVDPRLSWCYIPEIIIEIFKHLTTKDLKNVRLTCRLWNENCSRLSITEKEKFVIRVGSTRADIESVLSRTNYAQINLEIHVSAQIFTSLHNNYWRLFGHRVQVIDFSQSPACLSISILSAIILHCPNLLTLKIILKWDSRSYAENVLDVLIGEKKNLTKLRTFETMACAAHRYLNGSPMNLRLLKKFLLIFPRLEDLSIRRYDNRDGSDSIDETENMTFLNTLTQLKSLTYEVFSSDSWFQDPILSNWELRLTKFETVVVIPNDLTLMMKFLSKQTELKILKLTVREPVVMQVKTMIFHILECCTKLEEFHLSINRRVVFSESECVQFFTMIQQLKVLTTISSFSTGPKLSFLCTSKLSLKVLSLACVPRCLNCYFCIYLLEQCPTLEHLQLDYASDSTLQTIFSNLLHLRTLTLIEANECTDYGLIGRRFQRTGLSISRLQKLESLDIQALEKSFSISRVIQEFDFPCLKHLRLRVHLRPAVLVQLAEIFWMNRMPNLESLTLGVPYIRIHEYPTDLIVELISHLRRLTYLFVAVIKDDEKCECTIRRIFNACPSLRFLQTAGWVDYLTDGSVYAYDPTSGQITTHKCDTIDFVFRYPGYKSLFNHERLW